MNEYFVVYKTTDGSLQWKSNGPPGTAKLQQIESGMAVVVMPYEAFIALPANLDPMKKAVVDQINTGAGNFRLRFITDVPGQTETYLAKEAQARAWTSGADPNDFPYLKLEAAALGSTCDEVAADIINVANQWRALGPKIEARRRGATAAVIEAANIKDIVAAGLVDWDALLT